ncbi:class I SAM-dependent methyltransferase [Siphonobacter aquaeclarae]|uniref:Methyltransferase domain-containing protein n=1 Tax=Siphonobacter aquaeclarae TaxID=563176 RepID=A0A1G9RK50_9BACT|nr:class I SAM-dependent methyltransferase [Siphonobacter aquaeclarae]SDM23604.1 Methyltransferase domain-containing protein [Siphonobacter aquaeclarae]
MKDLFSRQSDLYARYRPTYPTELFDFILEYVPMRRAAWDCATGNGQVASVLSDYFTTVEATDISEKQLAEAIPRPNVHYQLSPAETTPFEAGTFDLVTVGQALHWFDFGPFFEEVKRVSRPGALFAAWGYELLEISPEVDPLILDFYENIVGPFWAPERKHIQEKYRNIPFPLQEIPAPEFAMVKNWTLEELGGYFSSWSSVQGYISQYGENPVPDLIAQISPFWPAGEVITVTFPVFLRMGRV